MIIGAVALFLGFNYNKHSFSQGNINFVGFCGIIESVIEITMIVCVAGKWMGL